MRCEKTDLLFSVFARDHPFAKPPDADEAKTIVRETFARDEWIEIPKILEQMERCDEFYFDSVSQILMPVWSRGRTVLVGDAAYCPSLLAGEGAALAMSGAYILAGELQRTNGDFSKAFAAYERQYREFIDRKQRTAESFAASFAPKTRWGLWVRDFVLRCANRFSTIGRWLTRRFVSDRFELPFYPN